MGEAMSRRGKPKGAGSPLGRLSALRRVSSSTVSDPTLGIPGKTLWIGVRRSGEFCRGLCRNGDRDRGCPAGLSGCGDTDLLELDGRNMELGCADRAVAGPRILVTGKACGITDSPLPGCLDACPEPNQLTRSRTERELVRGTLGLARALAETTTFSVGKGPRRRGRGDTTGRGTSTLRDDIGCERLTAEPFSSPALFLPLDAGTLGGLCTAAPLSAACRSAASEATCSRTSWVTRNGNSCSCIHGCARA
mmetsp:Transcript_28124/g.67555  ORF Transcript_28124/g.67555 Transcript_28124/m.67555 type:complete len:250 (-) Transcript_28124:636-1385(-)